MRVVLDLETTGLEDSDRIIEVGAIAIDDDLNEIARFEMPAFTTPGRITNVIPVVAKMHTDNGLWAELATAPLLTEVDERFAAWLKELGAKPGSVELIGRSIHFDLRFIRSQMPETHKLLHYRVTDVGAVLRTFAKAGVFIDIALPHPVTVHRSMPDCENELVELQAVHTWLQTVVQTGIAGPVKVPGTYVEVVEGDEPEAGVELEIIESDEDSDDE